MLSVSPRIPSMFGAVPALLVVGALLTACGAAPTRSVASYCSYLYGEGGKLRSRWLQADRASAQDPLGAVGTLFSAPHELADFFQALSLRAPEPIQLDVESLAENYRHIADQQGANADNPLAGLASGLVTGLASVRAERHFNYYSLAHCGRPPQ